MIQIGKTEEELSGLGLFFELAKLKQQEYELVMRSKEDLATKNRKIFRIVSSLQEQLLSSMEVNDAKQILKNWFKEYQQIKIKFESQEEEKDNLENPQQHRTNYFEAAIIEQNSSVEQRQQNNEQQQQILEGRLVGQKRSFLNLESQANEQSSLLYEENRQIFSYPPLNEFENQLANDDSQQQQIIVDLLVNNQLEQNFSTPQNKIKLAQSHSQLVRAMSKDRNLFVLSNYVIYQFPNAKINEDSMVPLVLDLDEDEVKTISKMIIAGTQIIVCYSHTLNKIWVLMHDQETKVLSQILDYTPMSAVTCLEPVNETSFFAGQLKYIELFDFTAGIESKYLSLQTNIYVNQISKVKFSEKLEYGIATSNGLQFFSHNALIYKGFGIHLPFQFSNGPTMNANLEILLIGKRITSFYEIRKNQFIVNLQQGNICMQIVDRAKNLVLSQIQSPSPSAQLFWIQLQPFQNFDLSTMDYFFLKENSSIYIFSLKTKMLHKVLDKKDLQKGNIEHDIISKYDANLDQISVFLTSSDLQGTYVEEYILTSTFLKALRQFQSSF